MKLPDNVTTPLTRRERKDLEVLALFTSVYCRAHQHGSRSPLQATDPGLQALSLHKAPVCPACAEFLAYAFERRLRCPLEEKPACKHCPMHCYKPDYRDKVRDIMRFSGKHLLRRGRLDLLWHYFF
jgi:hypothetical protein